MKKTLSLLMIILFIGTHTTIGSTKKKNNKSICVLDVNMSCHSCENKIKKNIAYEKGVRDIVINLEKKTVTITYISKKNTPDGLIKAIEKLGYKAKLIKKHEKDKKSKLTKKQ